MVGQYLQEPTLNNTYIGQKKLLSLLALLFLAASTGGCGNSQDEVIEEAIEAQMRSAGQEADVEVESDDDSVRYRIETGEGSMESTWSQNRLADGFPGDVPTYRGAELQASGRLNQNGMNGFTAQYMTSDSVEDVHQTLANHVKLEGWLEVMIQEMDGMVMMMYERDNRQLSYSIMYREEGTTITTTVMEQPDQ